MDKYFLLSILLILIASTSGCIDMLDTNARQMCLSATHYSTTSIPECNTQTSCLKKIENIETSKNIPIELNNNIIIYRNNIASSVYYFNKAKDKLKEINNLCKERKGSKIEDKINDLFFYMSNIFTYIDQSSESSIILLKNYAIYLESQDIKEIPEEEIYSDFIEINQNLNELKKLSDDKTYVFKLIKETEDIHKIAEEFGFKRTYLSKTNYIDLTSYYYKLISLPSSYVLVPKIAPGMNYIISKLSNIESYNKINKNLKNADSYNLFLVLDRIIGSKNSLFSKYIKINNKINKDIDSVFKKISYLEENISKNEEFLDYKNNKQYKIYKLNYKFKKISLGKYLSKLKELNNIIQKNKLDSKQEDIEMTKKIKDCNEIIDSIKNKNNIFFSYLTKKYIQENNYINKIKICERLKKNLNYKNCFSKLNDIYLNNSNLLYDINYSNIDNNKCITIINNINYKLIYNNKIKLLNEINSKSKKIILDIEVYSNMVNFETKKKLLNYKNKLDEIYEQENYEKIKDIDNKIDLENEIYNKLKNIAKEIEEKYLEKNYKIKLINKKYYLILENLFDFKLENIYFNSQIELSEIKNKDILNDNKIYIKEMYPGNNYVIIDYKNEKTIETNIRKLDLYKSVLETNIKNTVIGVDDKIYIDKEITLAEPNKYTLDEEGYVHYITKPINKILYYKKILTKTIESINIEKVNETSFVKKESFSIKNNFNKDIQGKINLTEIAENSIFSLKENGKEIYCDTNNDFLSFYLTLQKNQEKKYNLNILEDKKEIYSEIEKIFSEISNYKNSRFKNIKKEADNLFVGYSELSTLNEYKIEDIKKILNFNIDIINLKNKEDILKEIEKNYFILYNKIKDMNLNEEELEYIEKNNSEKYNDIQSHFLKLQEIYEKIKKKNKEQINLNKKKINEYKKIIEEYKIEDKDIIKDIKKLDENKNYTEIDQKLKKYFKNRALKLHNKIKLYYSESTEDIEKLIDNVYWLYEDYTVLDLFNVKYFPIITKADADRLKKKSKFLDTVTLSDQIYEFEENYNSKKYKEAINKIKNKDLNRLEDIYEEKELIKNGIEKFKKDAKNLLKNTDKKNKVEYTLARENYDLGKYINTIYIIKSIKIKKPKNQKNKQIIILITIIASFGLVYAYFNKGKKEISYNERKKKVLRHK